ncbi:hypothetical protein GDO86_010164 [Hymenochirus boettgeri]|uniref:Secreted protein n=1 Tax=Hymenochirus boettgeri TaxID=247094 RepID=A0A8T2JS81_9PIPI|nr:hypothetical protein GDO86_010164 [Hymenochirus boettgeri]
MYSTIIIINVILILKTALERKKCSKHSSDNILHPTHHLTLLESLRDPTSSFVRMTISWQKRNSFVHIIFYFTLKKVPHNI